MHAAAALAQLQLQHLDAELYGDLLCAVSQAYREVCLDPVSPHDTAAMDVRALPGLQQQLRATLLHLLSLLQLSCWQVSKSQELFAFAVCNCLSLEELRTCSCCRSSLLLGRQCTNARQRSVLVYARRQQHCMSSNCSKLKAASNLPDSRMAITACAVLLQPCKPSCVSTTCPAARL